LPNGLNILLLEDHQAPVIAYHTWFRVGSRHEKPGKTGLAHLFEHLMFNETESLPAGEFDRRLEEAGAESNASTWLDWTQYNVSVPREAFDLVVELEAERMKNLVLRDPQVTSEKEVVANERRYRVDDEVEGAVNELLWSTAYQKHAYGWPTIGWMPDIEGFTTSDCQQFYRTYYAPNNATVIVCGDITPEQTLNKISAAYGDMPSAELPVEDVNPEPPQVEQRILEIKKPTTTEKLALAYHGPALGDADHLPLSILGEVLFGGRASRVVKRLVRNLELASDVRIFVGPFQHPGLIEIFASARDGIKAEELLEIIDQELERVRTEPVAPSEIARALARFELSLLSGLETAEGKASTLGFYETVLMQPDAAFQRLEALRQLTPSDLLRVARRFFRDSGRTMILVRTQQEAA